tara:strand:- start:1631 stop:2557 length:927 start_codon:yes stop_codon:yes gene_type:complete
VVFGNLVENRICYKGDGAGGGDAAGQPDVDRFNPAEMRAREQRVENQLVREFNQGRDESDQIKIGSTRARDSFAKTVNESFSDIARKEREAAEAQAMGRTMSAATGERYVFGSGGGTDLPQTYITPDVYQNLTDRTNRTAPGMFGNESLPPNPLAAGLTAMGNANMANVKSKIDAGGTPVFDDQGIIQGVTHQGLFGGNVYSGNTAFDPFALQTDASGGDRPSDNVSQQPAAPAEPVDPGTTTPEQIDDLAVNYLQNPFYLYSGQGNLFQPYGYAGNTLVDLLQTRNMQMPGQAAPNLGLFGNPRDFS